MPRARNGQRRAQRERETIARRELVQSKRAVGPGPKAGPERVPQWEALADDVFTTKRKAA